MSYFDQETVCRELDTIGDFLRFAASQFNEAELYFGHGYDNAWDEAVALVLYALYLPPQMDQKVMPCKLTLDEKIRVLTIIEQRIEQQVPAAYIIQQAYFADLPFYVDERVLVPRSPIAELIEAKFVTWFTEQKPPKRILDLCTGSGCIAIACSYAFPEADIDAADLSIDALNVAQINIEQHGLLEQVIPIQSDIFSGVAGQRYDLIVTNPPYVDAEDVASMPAEYHHEPEMGLGSGEDGLDIVRQILAQAADFLEDEGVLICEVGNSQIHVQHNYPEVAFNWLTFERGGHGVFALTKAQLVEHQALFQQRAQATN